MHEPWLATWNYHVLQGLFQILAHRGRTDNFFDFLVSNQLVSTWLFAASFYWFWTKQDDCRLARRIRLFQIVVAFSVAVLISFSVRPWFSWPAPVLNGKFQQLYPYYLWGKGNHDSFPSHSTLVYFIVSVGIWPLSRRASVLLSLGVLALVSLPRVYIGGHYPIDVIASIVLAVSALLLAWHLPLPRAIAPWLTGSGRGLLLRELLVFFWIFELGERFRSTTGILHHLLRWSLH